MAVAEADTPEAAVAVADTPAAAVVEADTAGVAAWEVTLRQPVRAAPHWRVTAPLCPITVPPTRAPCTPLTRRPTNMRRANMRLPGLPVRIITTTTLVAASPNLTAIQIGNGNMSHSASEPTCRNLG